MLRTNARCTSAGKRGRDAVGIDGVIVQALRLEENLVARRGRRSASPYPRSTGNSAARAPRSHRRTAASGRSSPRMIVVGSRVRPGNRTAQLRRPDPVVERGHRPRPRSSLGCSSSLAQSIVRPSSRGGVPVFSRPCPSPISRICAASAADARSPRRPPATTSSPMNSRASRNVPVAMTRARHGRSRGIGLDAGDPTVAINQPQPLPRRQSRRRFRRAIRRSQSGRAAGRPAPAAPAPPAPCCD